MIKWILIGSLAMLTLFGCEAPTAELGTISSWEQMELPDSLSTRRIQFVLQLRDRLGEDGWPGFNEHITEGPLVYYNGDVSEIFFPDSIVRDRLPNAQFSGPYYGVAPRIDTLPFHLELMISFEPTDSNKVYFEHPVEQYLNVEGIRMYIPPFHSTEIWSTVVIHEMLHHFQYNHTAFRSYGVEVSKLGFYTRDLIQLMGTDSLFQKGVERENELLMNAIEADSDSLARQLGQQYLVAREARHQAYIESFPVLPKVEDFYVLQEGTARYVEYLAGLELQRIAREEVEPLLIQNDSLFNDYQDFLPYSLEEGEFSYLPYADVNTYHYALGFNIARLLDRLQVPYKEGLFEWPEVSLADRLASALATNR